MTEPATFDTVPQEVLEHIVFFSATETFLGPPSGLVPLLLTNRKIYSRLNISDNHHIYARIFAHKFDTCAVFRWLGPERTTSCILAAELQRRCFYLKRIRARSDSMLQSMDADDSPFLHELLFLAYTMMVENEGKNERQLKEYANMDTWLRDFWFHDLGASRAVGSTIDEAWLPDNDILSFGMWLFWFLLRPEFTAYASLLAGGGPSVIQKSMVVRHRQTWKLREHHLLASSSDSGIGLDSDNVETLRGGDPLRSWFPTGTQIRESRDGIEVHEPGRKDVVHYQRGTTSGGICGDNTGVIVQDIIITGEARSNSGLQIPSNPLSTGSLCVGPVQPGRSSETV
ncbi:hypothetical protein DXG03_008878 [Asterophora parasitica]|uniref:Uncharacterized protein n=1 Tax=Asterophora parasitica TaxID=117018 RepID=A0A9P7K8S2_9AGAR|nr:hypothetical protein DXG03_008878 [Asterophora parasitica]